MDPLTHTLVGANLASTRLGTKSRLATAACLIGANAPDIDVSAYFAGGDFAIGFRRGWTHGALAIVVLPMVVWAALMFWDRIGARLAALRTPATENRPPVHAGWLLALTAIAVITHPVLDWLNVYGMRWLMPFESTWFYGDAVFIMDPWLWLILAGAWLLPRRPTWSLAALWLVFAVLLALVVAGRAPQYLALIATIAVILLAALAWRPGDALRQHGLALGGLVLAGAYIAGMIALHDLTKNRVANELAVRGVGMEELMVGPLPVDSLGWDVLAVTDDHYRYGEWNWWKRELTLSDARLPRPPRDSVLWKIASGNPAIAGFMTWVRYPWIATERMDGGVKVLVLDARYVREPRAGFGTASVFISDEQRASRAVHQSGSK